MKEYRLGNLIEELQKKAEFEYWFIGRNLSIDRNLKIEFSGNVVKVVYGGREAVFNSARLLKGDGIVQEFLKVGAGVSIERDGDEYKWAFRYILSGDDSRFLGIVSKFGLKVEKKGGENEIKYWEVVL
jgi:hypothetical protein